MDDLNEKFDQKANLDDMLKEFNVLKESIISLNARKHVDPASHATHGKEIEELDDRITRMERYGGDIEYLNSKSDDVSKALKTNEELIYKVLAEIGDKANLKEVSDLTTKVSHTQNNINKIINHLNELQKQIDKIQDDSGPDYSKMINAIEKRLETIQDAFNQRMYDNEKTINRLEEDVGEFKKMADKTDIGLIKLIQQVDSIQIKLDLLDQAFNGFMVPSGLLHGNQDNSLYDALRESIASLRREYFKFKDEAGANFALIGETLSKNADKHDLKDLENRLQEKIDSNEKSTIKNKSEFRRILKDIEDKIKRGEGGTSSRGRSLNKDDALLARKHEGWKCATCEKDLVNMAGLPVEFFNWKKMPKRDKERVPMMGQGFSRMLQTVSPDMTLPSTQTTPHKHHKFLIKDDQLLMNQSIRRNSGIEQENSMYTEKLPNISSSQ